MTITKQGSKLVIVLDTEAVPALSRSGKYSIVESTGGFAITEVISPTGKPMTLSLMFGYNRK